MNIRTIFFTIIFSNIVFSSFCQETAQQKFKKLAWLEGSWKRTNAKAEQTGGEEWKRIKTNYLKGYGYTVAKQDTVFKEGLEILIKDAELYYVATVSTNAEQVFFKFTEITSDSFVCVNEANDFPKKIAYKITNGTIKATISGGGNPVDFIFIKK